MYRESMPDIDFADALSSTKQKISQFVSTKSKEFSDWLGLRRKKYVVNKYYNYAKDNFITYGKAYGKYFAFELLPFVVAFGVMINIPVSVLLGWAFTVETVVSWGLVFYFVSEELTDIANDLKPYIRVSAKVDN